MMLSTNILFFIDLATYPASVRFRFAPSPCITTNFYYLLFLPSYIEIYFETKLALVIGGYFGLRLRNIIEFRIVAIAHRERHTVAFSKCQNQLCSALEEIF